MTAINGVTDARAARLAAQGRRDMSRMQREDAQRIERVCAAIREAPGIPDHMKAKYARTILTHPIHLSGRQLP
jgi:hypothetical protein